MLQNRGLMLFVVIMAGLALQAIYIGVESKEEAHTAAVAFAKAYFKLEPGMARRLCDESRIVDDVDVVNEFIYQTSQDSSERGFGPHFVKSQLYHIKSYTSYAGEDQATVRITATRRTAINPIYVVLARLFCIGETHHVDQHLNLVREDGQWKVCGDLASLFG